MNNSSLNNGKPIKMDLDTMSEVEMQKYAKEFAEGSKALERLLLNLWKNNIETCSSCAGHEDDNFAYIVVSVCNFKQEYLNNVLNIMFNLYNKGEINISFTLTSKFDVKDSKTICFNAKNNNTNKFFELVESVLLKPDQYKLTKENSTYVKTVAALFSLSLEKYYLKTNKISTKQFGFIDIFSKDNKLFITTYNNAQYKFATIKNKEGKPLRYKFLEGYYTKTKDGEFYTVQNSEIVKIKDFHKYKRMSMFKRYNSIREFSFKEINSILEEIKN